MRRVVIVVVVVVFGCVGGCGGATAANGHEGAVEPSLSDDDDEGPPTDADPSAWVPTPEDDPGTGRAVAIATSGGYDQARAVAIRFVRAVRDGDEAALSRMLAERVGHVFPRLTSPNGDRAEFINLVLRSPGRTGLGADVPLDELIDLAHIEVAPLLRNAEAIPPGLSGSDLLVQFPLHAQGRRFRLFISGWTAEGHVVVRPGVEPQILCF